MAKVIMTCGRICCGKSTYARKLQENRNAVVLSIDDITLTLFPEGAGEMHDTYVLRAEQYLLSLSLQILESGVDVILEISGASSIYETMADYLRKEGKIMLLAHPGERVSFDIMKTMHHSGATIKGIFGRRIWDSWDALTELVASGKVDLTKVITHRFPLSAGNKAFEQIAAGSGKVLFIPEWED